MNFLKLFNSCYLFAVEYCIVHCLNAIANIDIPKSFNELNCLSFIMNLPEFFKVFSKLFNYIVLSLARVIEALIALTFSFSLALVPLVLLLITSPTAIHYSPTILFRSFIKPSGSAKHPATILLCVRACFAVQLMEIAMSTT